jgi:hypothetical protein
MKEISLPKNLIAIVDDEDFEFLTSRKWNITKGLKTYYAVRNTSVNGNTFTEVMHRLIMKVSDSSVFIDHIDGNGLNNQKSNLRIATRSQNNANRLAKKNGTSKYLGVCRIKNRDRFQANITKDGKQYALGYFTTEEAAAKAYNEAAIRLHGEFANLNIF